MDTPGHPNFVAELVAAMRVADGVVLVVDVIEGVMIMTERIIKQIVREDLDVIVVLNKLDRLVIEMKIPPEDAYLKLKHTLEEINGLFSKHASQLGVPNRYLISPTLNNVVFAAAEYSFMFSIDTMVSKYRNKFKLIDTELFKKVLWGDYYFNAETKKFSKNPPSAHRRRAFVEFILDPIYKIFSHTVGKDKTDLETFLVRNLAICLTA